MSLNKIKVKQHWHNLKQKHFELDSYTLEFDNAKSRYGSHHYSKKIISISNYHLIGSNWEEVLDTLLHEASHALAYNRYGKNIKPHGKEWKMVCEELGAIPQRVNTKFSKMRPQPKYTLICPICGKTYHRHRIGKSRQYSCGICSTEFDNKYILKVVVNY